MTNKQPNTAKTETLIKLADVFEISTEELLNTIHQEDSKEINSVVNSNNSTENICEEKIIVNKIDATQANAKEGKTLLEFRAERGLYIKDVVFGKVWLNIFKNPFPLHSLLHYFSVNIILKING